MPIKHAASLFSGLLLASLALFAGTAVAQEGQADSAETPGLPPGFAEVESQFSVEETVGRIQQAVQSADGASVVTTIDHAQNAQGAGLELRPTQVVLFGNPALGTPLMQANQLAGLDLPQKMLVYEDAQGQTHVAYNTPDYLAARHGISGVGTLDQIGQTLSNLAANSAGSEVQNITAGGVGGIETGEGVVALQSNFGPEETFNRLQSAIGQKEAVSVVTTLDHAQNAQKAGMELRPTKLLVAGNPMLGTPLMQAAQTTGIDLPQKFLVYEDAQGQTFVAYNDPFYVAGRHGIEGADSELQKISTALQGFAEQATGNQMQTPQTGGISPLAIGAGLLGGLVLLGAGGALYRRSSSSVR